MTEEIQMRASREHLDELRGRWDSRMRAVRHLIDKYEADKTDANWEEYQEMVLIRDASWSEYEAAMKTMKDEAS